MGKQCLSHHHIDDGTWTEGQQVNFIQALKTVELTPLNKVVIYELAHSGHVLVTRSGESSGSHGHGGGHNLSVNVHSGPTTLVVTDTQIYANIVFVDETNTFISAPLRTSLEFSNVSRIELNFLFIVGPPGWKKSEWSSLVNAHVIYEETKSS